MTAVDPANIFRFPFQLGTALGYDELDNQKKSTEDIAADLAYWSAQLEDFVTNVAQGAQGVGTTRTEHSPTLVQSSTVASTATYSEYRNINGFVTWTAKITVDAAGTGNNKITLSLPVNAYASAVGCTIGNGHYFDLLTAIYPIRCELDSTSTMELWRTDTAAASELGIDPNFAVAANDFITFTVVYPSA